MTKYTNENIKITNLLLNTANPRFETVESQRDALQAMISEIGDKMLVLADDIVQNGINPSELVIVIPSGEKNKYLVREGNRRVAVLKLLAAPEMFKVQHKSFTNRLNKIIKKSGIGLHIKEIPCVAFVDANDANRWIELKHTGENKGKGVVPWDAQQTARFKTGMSNKQSVGLQVLDFLKGSSGESTEKTLKKVSITNLERLLTDKNVQSVLGIQINDKGIVETGLLRDEIKKGLLKIANDIASKKVKVKHIYTKEDRKKYIETFKPGQDIPDQTKQANSVWALCDEDDKKPMRKTKSRSSVQPIDRDSLIPRNCILSIREAKINRIYTELKNMCIETYTNASAVLFRVFLELSIDTYSDKYSLPKTQQGGRELSLRQRLDAVVKHMEDNGIATKDELKGVRVIVQQKDGLYTVDTFNDYVHNRHFSPEATSLKLCWDNIQIFMEKLWSNV